MTVAQFVQESLPLAKIFLSIFELYDGYSSNFTDKRNIANPLYRSIALSLYRSIAVGRGGRRFSDICRDDAGVCGITPARKQKMFP